jgi:hypothetical protein
VEGSETAGYADSFHVNPDENKDAVGALDPSDLDLLASRIRIDCRNLIHQLQLDHLIDH